MYTRPFQEQVQVLHDVSAPKRYARRFSRHRSSKSMREITSLDSQSLDSQSGVLGKPQGQDDVYNDSEVSTSGMRMRFRLDNAQ
mgnify:CR=1 FL=1